MKIEEERKVLDGIREKTILMRACLICRNCDICDEPEEEDDCDCCPVYSTLKLLSRRKSSKKEEE